LFLFFSSLFLTFLLLHLRLFFFSVKLVKISLAGVDNSFLCLFLIGKEVGPSSQEAKHGIKETVDVTFLLNDGHENAVELALFVHV
jgi:hypothetical protein